jgi:hypothetical protein
MAIAKQMDLNAEQQAKKFIDDANGNFELAELLLKTATDAAHNQLRPLKGTTEYWQDVEKHLQRLKQN